MLTIEKLSKNLAGRLLLEQADLMVHPGERVGLIGPNGTGKTTLLRMIIGEMDGDGGTIRMRGGIRTGLLRQEILSTNHSLLEETLAGNEELMQLRREQTTIQAQLLTATSQSDHESLSLRMGEIDSRLTSLQAYSAEGRAAVILTGLGFSPEDLERPLLSFSGGWRMRAQLARLLFARPDLLLLDEPTNHLDMETATWLENHLKKNTGSQAIIIVSHDRSFLNRTTNVTVELENGRLTRYAGPFDAWLEQKAMNLQSLEKSATVMSRKREELECFIRRFRAKATKARQVQSRVKALERMEPVAQAGPTLRPPKIRFPTPPSCAMEVVKSRNLGKSYDGKTIFSGANLELQRGQKIGLVGVNGSGKSTLLKLIAGELSADAGTITLGDRVRMARFAQHALERLKPEQTVLESAASAAPEHFGDTALRTLLGGLLFSGEAVQTRVINLSGGERVRLALAHLFLSGANLLLLDEPANHLDMAARAALEEALTAYPGAVILVTHDRDLMETTCDGLWVVSNGTVVAWDGNLESYLAQAVREEGNSANPTPSPTPPSTRDPREIRRLTAQIRDRLRQETLNSRKQLEKLEKQITALESERATLQAKLADPNAYTADSRMDLKETVTRVGLLEQELKTAMTDWETLSLEIESRESEAEQALAQIRADLSQ
ncbi:MAG: ABC-F family ATP-binding cassette domain-containing protein [Magnetococcales bacterium]|nr:ABC-F family ATP-binding cassette domain-containing protein [Magnetococcales bacterium]